MEGTSGAKYLNFRGLFGEGREEDGGHQTRAHGHNVNSLACASSLRGSEQRVSRTPPGRTAPEPPQSSSLCWTWRICLPFSIQLLLLRNREWVGVGQVRSAAALKFTPLTVISAEKQVPGP